MSVATKPMCRKCGVKRRQALGLCNSCSTAMIGDRPHGWRGRPLGRPAAVKPAPAKTSWWTGLDRRAFEAAARARFPEAR